MVSVHAYFLRVYVCLLAGGRFVCGMDRLIGITAVLLLLAVALPAITAAAQTLIPALLVVLGGLVLLRVIA
jgi:hypothetical protein